MGCAHKKSKLGLSDRFLRGIVNNFKLMENSLFGEDAQEVAMCDICSLLCQRKVEPYKICRGHHVVCQRCLSGHSFQTRCPICQELFKDDKNSLASRFIELMEWEEIMKLTEQQKKVEAPGEFNAEAQMSNNNKLPRESPEKQTRQFSLGIAQTFTEFYQSDDQAFMGVRIRIQGYLLILFVQLLFSIFNFYFGLQKVDQSLCQLQEKHQVIVYQSWLTGVAILEVVFMAFALLFVIFYKNRCVNEDQFDKCWSIIKVACSFKILLWGIIQIVIFLRGIPEGCVSGLQTFGMINAIIHVFMLSAVLAQFSKLRKRLLFIALQLYLAFFNIYYACKDLDELEPVADFRPTIQRYQWWMGVAGFFEVCFLVAVVLLYRFKLLGLATGKLGYCMLLIYLLKLLLWSTVQCFMLIVYRRSLSTCSGGLYVYVVINTILHLSLIAVGCWKRLNK